LGDVLQRADEPGEFLAYWTSTFGRALPKPVKRGIGDAVRRLYTEYALLKYDTASKGFRFGDVLDLTHPDAATPQQGDRWPCPVGYGQPPHLRRSDRLRLSADPAARGRPLGDLALAGGVARLVIVQP
jgi:hypothetical protein